MTVKLSPLENAISGSLGAMISNTIVYPLDIVKTRLQVQNPDDPENTNYKSAWDALSHIVKEEGYSALFHGLGANLVGTASSNFSYFFFYGWLRKKYESRLLGGPGDKLNTMWELLLGSHAAALGQMFTIPVSVIVTRQQTLRPAKSFQQTVIDIISEDGVRGLWKGLAPSLILCINPAITYACFEKLKQYWLRNGAPGSEGKLTPVQAFLIGALSKTMATIITYPYIMAKVRLQWKPKDSSRKELLYKGILDVMQKVYRQEGIPGLFNGIKAQIIKAVMAQALLFMMKDELDRNVWLISLALYRLLPAPVVQTSGKKEL